MSMYIRFICDGCHNEQDHPSMLRSNPRCERCSGPMSRVRRPDATKPQPQASKDVKVDVLIAPMHGPVDPPPFAIMVKNGKETLIRVELSPEDFALALSGRIVQGTVTRGHDAPQASPTTSEKP